jgi:hypothetical protein
MINTGLHNTDTVGSRMSSFKRIRAFSDEIIKSTRRGNALNEGPTDETHLRVTISDQVPQKLRDDGKWTELSIEQNEVKESLGMIIN